MRLQGNFGINGVATAKRTGKKRVLNLKMVLSRTLEKNAKRNIYS